MKKITPLADDYVRIFESPYPKDVYTYSPGIAVLESGRIVATLDMGGAGMDKMDGPKGIRYGSPVQGKVFISDDKGETWKHTVDFPYHHARPFAAGKSLYVLGQAEDLMIIRSDDDGETWSEPSVLTKGEDWHQAPANVHYANGNVYLVMERRPPHDCKAWGVSVIAPVLMRANVESDLTKRDSWTFASEMVFRDVIDEHELDYFGVPFYKIDSMQRGLMVAPGRYCAPVGWLESNVVQFVDDEHIWNDPAGHTFHIWMRAHTGGTGYAAILKVMEKEDGSMQTMFEKVPSGKKIVFVPCPGGQMKFHILYDEVTKLYWLLSTQATDSMIKPEKMPENRFNLPNNERQRLQLHFSKNCIDWCFAGLVDKGATQKQSRHYASMAIDGDDLYVLSRSGDENAYDAHQTNFISFHKIKRFRDLVY